MPTHFQHAERSKNKHLLLFIPCQASSPGPCLQETEGNLGHNSGLSITAEEESVIQLNPQRFQHYKHPLFCQFPRKKRCHPAADFTVFSEALHSLNIKLKKQKSS